MSNYDSSTITLNLPLPPSVNNYYGHTAPVAHKVIKYVKEAGKNFRTEVREYVKKNHFDIKANIPLKVEVLINFPTNHRTDIDNRMKGLLDALTYSEVFEDDSLIDELHITRGFQSKPGGCIVKISEANQDGR